MIEELEELINFIQNEYIEFNRKWQESRYYLRINLKDNLVCDLLDNKPLLDSIFNYREFINENSVQLSMDFKQFNSDYAKVNSRVKAKNSIEYKIKNYIENHVEGVIPINKCFNDLFGIRIICLESLDYQKVKKFIEEKYKLKCIDSSKVEGYKAIHIYFRQGSFNFQWELQVWNKEDEFNNINSHEKYKQDYVRWEQENKGGKK